MAISSILYKKCINECVIDNKSRTNPQALCQNRITVLSCMKTPLEFLKYISLSLKKRLYCAFSPFQSTTV